MPVILNWADESVNHRACSMTLEMNLIIDTTPLCNQVHFMVCYVNKNHWFATKSWILFLNHLLKSSQSLKAGVHYTRNAPQYQPYLIFV